jgi:N,N'-diacetyllegionaminate synthase
VAAGGPVSFRIGAREIGQGLPCFIVAEVGLAHEGSVSQAHAYVDAVRRSGADAVKFQCHLGDSTTEWRVEPKWHQDEDRQAYWMRTGFTAAEWWGLRTHCQQAGLEFLCSPFSVKAVTLLNPIVNAWKIPSGQLTSRDLLAAVTVTRKPVLLSTGMGSFEEVNTTALALDALRIPLIVMQCVSLYPCPPAQVGLSALSSWAQGLSDHSGTIYPGIAAAVLGCQVLEVHVCWSKDQGGFDTAASITTAQLGELVRGVRFVEQAMRPVDKDRLAERLGETRRVFMGVA